MSDLALDPATGDLLLDEAGRAGLCVGAEAVAQAWACHLTLFRGECFLDPTLGIDYQGVVLVKSPRAQVLRALFAQATRETPGVAAVSKLRFALDRGTRVLSIEATVVLEEGDEERRLALAEAIGGS
jgi:hypothetical protein